MNLWPDSSKTPVFVKLLEPGEDIELKAMAWTWSVLCQLNQTQRDRAVAWLVARNIAASLEPVMSQARCTKSS